MQLNNQRHFMVELDKFRVTCEYRLFTWGHFRAHMIQEIDPVKPPRCIQLKLEAIRPNLRGSLTWPIIQTKLCA